jgi:hypothetical protein
MIHLRATKRFSALELPRGASKPLTALEQMCAELDLTGRTVSSNGMKMTTRKFSALGINSPTGSPTGSPTERPKKVSRPSINSEPKISPPNKGVPNYFIGIRLNCPIFQKYIEAIQDEIKNSSPHLSKCMTSSRKLHLTSFVLELRDPDFLQQAVNCFESCASAVKAIADRISEKALQFNSLNRFTSNVLFVAPMEDACLLCLKEISIAIATAFSEIALIPQDCLDRMSLWQPHATIAKTSADRSKAGKKLKILASDYESCDSIAVFSKELPVVVPLSTIDLLSMQHMDKDGYYSSLASISLVD